MEQDSSAPVAEVTEGVRSVDTESNIATCMEDLRGSNFIGRALRAVVARPAKALVSGVRRLRQFPERCRSCFKAVGAGKLLDGYPTFSFSSPSFSNLDTVESELWDPEHSSCLHSGVLAKSSSEHSSLWRREEMCDIPDSSCSLSSDRLSFDFGYLPSFRDSGIGLKLESSSEFPASNARASEAVIHVMHISPGNSGPSANVSSNAPSIERNPIRSNGALTFDATECRSDVVVDLPAAEVFDEIVSASSSSEKGCSMRFSALYKQLAKTNIKMSMRSNNVGPKLCRPWRSFFGDRSYVTTPQRGMKYQITV